MELRTKQAQEWFAYDRFIDDPAIVDKIVKIVSNSSLVSVFEKPKFKEAVSNLGDEQRQRLSDAFQSLLHGDPQEGFEGLVQILDPLKVAKWPILTVIPTYHKPGVEVFVKPTTAKQIIQYFEVKELTYSPKPTWSFYIDFKALIGEMKTHIRKHSNLTENNAAFCGFLMTSINQ